RMLDAYLRSGTTLNLIRAFTMGGYADLREVHSWNRGFTDNPAYKRFEAFAGEIDRAMRFMEAAGVDFDALKQVDFYAAHEALLLEYEDAMTRRDSRTGDLYGTSAHLLWIGERTRGADDAHAALLAGVRNPIGVKLGPTTTPGELTALIDRLNPDGEPGRMSVITRMGSDRVRDALPPLIEAARADGRPLTWITDPMHGNTITSDNGYKTRRFEAIMDEVRGFFEVHRALGTVPGGIHVELTGGDVTEVLGGGE
ncbi:3-deoxy-7-phosphoheptulonate synthase, partial [Actinomyces denticolens]